MRVVAALSGGVDSAVAAALAVDAGHEVVGVHLALAGSADRDDNSQIDYLSATATGPLPSGGQAAPPTCESSGGRLAELPSALGRTRGCCTPADRHDAARAADVIGIPFYVWDFAAEFDRDVVTDFVAEYTAGRTPNPCIRCNQRIKFAAMLERAVALGFDAICTGHYARLGDVADIEAELDTRGMTDRSRDDPDGQRAAAQLHRGVDRAKDQSYVLAVLTPEQLARSIFPLGAWTKSQVRAEAARRVLLVADKPDSSDICFIPDGNTKQWLTDRIGARQGNIIDAQSGVLLGTHGGVETLTVGQRRGLRLTVPATDGQPRYVVSTDLVKQEVAVGPAHLLDVDQILVDEPNWCGEALSAPFECAAQVRAHGEPVEATVTPVVAPIDLDDLASPDRRDRIDAFEARLSIRLSAPIRGVAPGQTLVMYEGTRVIGSATIVRTERWADLATASAKCV